jgi:hypothetical protein
MAKQSHYPNYDVMQEKNQWDDHTQTIVTARVIRERNYKFLSLTEAEMLRAIAVILIDDDRPELTQYIICHIGEGERKTGVPQERQLIRDGLKTWNDASIQQFLTYFIDLTWVQQRSYVEELSTSNALPSAVWGAFPQQALFNKLLQMCLEAYYSHPIVWSEIGYGGPAYPRGYVRTEIGQLDPWEAKTET